MGEVELAFHVSAWPEDEFVSGLAGITEAGFRAMEASCLACARCYRHCPRQHVLDGPDTPGTGADEAPQQSS